MFGLSSYKFILNSVASAVFVIGLVVSLGKAEVVFADIHKDDGGESLAAVEKSIEILSLFYDKKLEGLELLMGVFDPSWLKPETNFELIKTDLEARLISRTGLGSLPSSYSASDVERQLIELKLRWVYFSTIDREKLIASAQNNKLAKTSKDTLSTVGQVTLEAQSRASVVKKAAESLGELHGDRGKRLSSILSKIESTFELIAEQTSLIGAAQLKFNGQSQQWNKLLNEVNNALEDEGFLPGTQNFKEYRVILLSEITRANKLVKSESAFLAFYFGSAYVGEVSPVIHNIQVRELDDEATRQLIDLIYRKQIEVQTSLESLRTARAQFIVQLVVWNNSYRKDLLNLRGLLIERVLHERQSFAQNILPLKIELKTIGASVAYYFWQQEYQVSDSKWALSWIFGVTFHLFKLLAVSLLCAWLLFKRSYVVALSTRFISHFTSFDLSKNHISVAMDAIKYPYIFLVILMFGYFSLECLLSVGITFAASLKPVLARFSVFLLCLGVLDLIVKLIGRRDSDGRRQGESGALEMVFEFIPRLILFYWLLAGLVSILLYQMLNHSVSDYYAAIFLRILFSVALFFMIWVNRESWRVINSEATKSDFWHRITASSCGRVWEPFVLFIGGGIGVYRLAWQLVTARLIDLEITRSFQAMVNRALLERQHAKSTAKLDPAWFPGKYWSAFNFMTPAEPAWHIPRDDVVEILKQSFDDWQNLHSPARILVCGDRGVGKSEFIAKFLRDIGSEAKKCLLNIGDASEAAVLARLGSSLLNQDDLDEAGLVSGIQSLPAQVIVIENLENTLLRRVGGFDAFATVIDVMLQNGTKHLWITTCTSHAWVIAKQALIGANNFTDIIQLKGLSEEQVKGLLLSRHNSNSSVVPDFSQLNLKEVSKKSSGRMRQSKSPEDKGSEMYFRILWDYTRGNPRQALYYWKASLSWDGDKTLVRLFDVPDQRVLENLPDDTLMLLAALVEHNGLDIMGLSSVMNGTVPDVRRRLEELTPYGMVFSIEKGQNVEWHIESFWTKAVVTYLEKRQFLFKGKSI